MDPVRRAHVHGAAVGQLGVLFQIGDELLRPVVSLAARDGVVVLPEVRRVLRGGQDLERLDRAALARDRCS